MKQEQILTNDHTSAVVKTRKLTQVNKKLKCPVSYSVKKIFKFSEFKVNKDTRYNRYVTSKKLRDVKKNERMFCFLFKRRSNKGH